MCSWTRWLSVSHSSCTLTFSHFSQKFKRGPRWLLFSFCEKRGTVSEPTLTATVYTSVETCISRSLSPVPLKPADLYTQQVLNGRAGSQVPNLKWPLKETFEFCIIYRKQTSNQYSLSSFDIVLDNSQYILRLLSLEPADYGNWSSRSIWNLESRLSQGTRK